MATRPSERIYQGTARLLHSDAAKRLRQRLAGLQILMPGDFLREHGQSLLNP